MNVNTKVTLYTIIPLGYDPIDCTAIDYSVSENALTIECAEVDRLITRAEAAEDKATQNWIEVERLDEELARAEAYIERIRQAMGGYRDSDLASLAETLNARNAALEAENASLREQVARLTAELADLSASYAELLDKTGDWYQDAL